MASRIIHLAIAELIADTKPELNTDRFFLGSILPDACRDRSAHYSVYTAGGTKKTHDLTSFRAQYGERLRQDALYLGYYLHLVQDILFRKIMYEELRFDSRPAGNVERLHLDYRLTNGFVVRRYNIKTIPAVPADLTEQPLWQAHSFALQEFLEEMKIDFLEPPEGSTVYFTEEIALQFIERAGAVCRKELEAVRSGEGYFDERRFAWKRRDSIQQADSVRREPDTVISHD